MEEFHAAGLKENSRFKNSNKKCNKSLLIGTNGTISEVIVRYVLTCIEITCDYFLHKHFPNATKIMAGNNSLLSIYSKLDECIGFNMKK